MSELASEQMWSSTSGPPAATEVGPPHQPWRVRDLRGPSRVIAAVLVLGVVAIFVVAFVRAKGDDWVPAGDEAHIAVRSLDVFSSHPPVTGQPSTSYIYADGFTYHPGPIEFYLMAVPMRVLGGIDGPLLTAGLVNAAAVLIALWAVYRRAGPGVALWAGVLLHLVLWSAGTSVLVDTLSSNMTFYPVLCTAVLAWALLDGDLRLLPLAALVASYAGQQHLAAGILVGAMAVTGVVGLAVRTRRARRAGHAGAVDRRTVRRFVVGALLVAVVSALPVLIDETPPGSGNISNVLEYGADSDRPVKGLRSGVAQVLRAISPPTVLGTTDLTGFRFAAEIGWSERIGGGLAVLALVGVGWRSRRTRPALARLVAVSLVFLVAAAVTGGNVPLGAESSRINLYRWTWTAALLTWTAVGWGVARELRPRLEGRPLGARVHHLGPPALAGAAALLVVSTVAVRSADDSNRDRPAFDVMGRAQAAALEAVGDGPVLVFFEGPLISVSVANSVIARLVQEGVDVQVRGGEEPFFGEHRVPEEDEVTSALLVRGGDGPLGDAAGEVLFRASLQPEVSGLLDELAAPVRPGDQVEVDPEADEVLARMTDDVQEGYARALLDVFGREPRAGLANRYVLRLVADGLVTSPGIDRAKARRLQAVFPEERLYLSGDRVELRLLTAEEVEDELPRLLERTFDDDAPRSGVRES